MHLFLELGCDLTVIQYLSCLSAPFQIGYKKTNDIEEDTQYTGKPIKCENE